MASLTWIAVAALLGLSTLLNIIVPFSGSSTITPLLSLIFEPHQALGIASFFFFLGAPPRIFFFRKHIRWEEIKALLLPSAIAAAVGAFALIAVPPLYLLVTVFAFALWFLLKKLGMTPPTWRSSGTIASGATGILSGFLQGTGLAGSDVRAQYLYARGLTISEVHGTTAIIGGTNFLIATGARVSTNQVSFPDLLPLLYLFPVIVFATWLGRSALYKLPQRVSESIITCIMIAVVLLLGYKIATLAAL